MKIILASASPRRRELMRYIAGDFIAVPADCDETLPRTVGLLKASEYLARIKADHVYAKYPDNVVIGCDTTVICGSRILGKPKDKDECRAFLEMLSGRTHQVVTGCAIVYRDRIASFSVITDVTFRELSDDDIEWYISTEEPYDKAGGYGIQGWGSLLVEKINGDFYNVVGLPVSRLDQELKKFLNDINE